MQHPVGYKMSDGSAELDERLGAPDEPVRLLARSIHTILAGLTAGSMLVLGSLRAGTSAVGETPTLFQRAAMLALVGRWCRVSAFNLWFGSHFGIVTTELTSR